MIVLSRMGLLAFVFALLATAIPANAQPTAEQIVRRARSEIAAAVRANGENVATAAERGIRLMIRADRNGATDEELTAAAEQTKARIDTIAQRGQTAVAAIAARSVARLTDMGADQALIDQVNQAAGNGAQVIANRRDRAKGRVDAALARLLG